MDDGTAIQYGDDPVRDRNLADVFVLLADTLVAEFDVVDVLSVLARVCVDVLGATAAGILLGDQRGNLTVMASSSEQSHLLEVFQLQNDEGPCLECYRSGVPVTEVGLEEATGRWPQFAPKATSLGYRAVYALPMRLRSDTIGALNLFSDARLRMPDHKLRVAQALADTATIGILQQRAVHASSLLAEQLQTALNSRVVIEQAKGVLAAYGQLDMDQAFTALRSHARNKNLRLSDVSRDIAAGSLDPRVILDQGSSVPPRPGSSTDER